MIKNKICFRISEQDTLNFVERKTNEKGITVSKFINDCLRKCMEQENAGCDFDAINEKIIDITEQYNSLVESNNQIVNFVSTVFLTSSILLQGRINEYKAKNVDPYKFYNQDIREIASKFNFPMKIDFSELDKNN